jgi:hypothetical protein
VKKLGIFFFLDFHIPLEAMHLHFFPFWSNTKRVSTIRNRVLSHHTLLSSVDDDGIWGTEKNMWEATSTSGTRHPEVLPSNFLIIIFLLQHAKTRSRVHEFDNSRRLTSLLPLLFMLAVESAGVVTP